ncbi:hypothetical protein RBWH47_01164 [Rhodopirellula baltica WH47]|uniref:Uncharacterized protein n=1 Tax=Rhodopirellula baltica WH47 TaxID=991778 RepID=F2B236_RHOBT|nr:hypothetical protein RBWH47_01164 [Rhodopirellula baltica WH47]
MSVAGFARIRIRKSQKRLQRDSPLTTAHPFIPTFPIHTVP